jgi:peptidoglycan/xylan/chitin deacetylase (PgdA/CDA1 family)
VSFLHVHAAHAKQAIDCPVYLFHITSVAVIDRVIRASAREGRVPVTVSQLAAMMQGEAEIPDAPLFAMTFDDGYLIQYQQAAPLLDRWEVPATFFVMGTGWQGDGVHTYMRGSQIQDLAARGHEIGSHTVNHPNLVSLRTRNLGAYLGEIVSSKVQLEDLLQAEVTSFCYPNGAYNAAIVEDVSRIYYAAASEISGRTQGNAFLLRRTRPS